MLNIHNLSVAFAGEYLFQNIAFRLNPGDRVGLIGKNGAGKSTLLQLLSKDIAPDTGTIATDKDLNIGFLRQDIDFEQGRTVVEEAYQAFSEIKAVEQQLEAINTALAERTDYESEAYHQLMVDLTEVSHRYEILGGYHYQGNAEKVLLGLGFAREDFTKPTDTFSGGWRMRIELAKLLLQNNDVLLLDEPTNHLDIESILWLEQFLNRYAGAIVVVSHDTLFLNNVTNRTIEITTGRIYDYNKPYSKFLAFRKEIREQQRNAQKNQQKYIEHTQKLIEKFRAKATKATMAQSLIKKLHKIDRIVVEEEDTRAMHLTLPVSVTPGKVVAELQNLSKSYGPKQVLHHINLLVERGSKIAFVGQNGQGKTTLAKILVGALDYTGTLRLGHNVQIGYFAQNQAEYLNGEQTILNTMLEAANESNRSKVRNLLGAFLFRGDEVDKYVKVLSGGERNRLALAKMLLQPFNMLVMDEPTNHLDVTSKNVLKQALQRFTGTLILVSHDREFLQGVTDRVYEFKNGAIKPYLGDIDFYLQQRQADDFRTIEKGTAKAKDTPVATTKQHDYHTQKKRKSLQNRLSKVEKQISQLEKEIATLDQALVVDYNNTVAQPNFFDTYQNKKKRLETLMENWEDVSHQLETLK